MASVRRWWGEHFLGAETALAVVATVLFVVWLHAGGTASLDRVLSGRRATLYGTVAGISATLLGFVLAVAAIVLTFGDSERFTILRESKQYPTLWRTFTSAIRVLCFSTVASLVALLVDREHPNENRFVMVLCFFALVWALLRILRSIWALEGIIRIATKPVPRSS